MEADRGRLIIANLRGRLLGTVRHQFGLITLNQTNKSARALTNACTSLLAANESIY